MIRKFNVKATRTDEYIIEIDDEVIDKQWIENFEGYMYKLDEEKPLEDLTRDLAYHQMRVGSERRFIEGFGNVLRDGKMPFSFIDFDAAGKELPEDQKEKPAPGLNIYIDTEDEDYEFEIEEAVEI